MDPKSYHWYTNTTAQVLCKTISCIYLYKTDMNQVIIVIIKLSLQRNMNENIIIRINVLLKKYFIKYHQADTVDGWNPAPPRMYEILKIMG